MNDCEARRTEIQSFHPDTIILLNVLEHIDRHQEALQSLRAVSSPNARIVLLVPTHNAIYNGLDRQAGHFRRYSRTSLRRCAETAGWRTIKCRYVNAVGIPGWILAGLVNMVFSRREQLDSASTNYLMRLYDRWFTGLSASVDRVMGSACGLSVFYVGSAE